MDFEDIELERLLAEKQHKELVSTIKQLGLLLTKDDTKSNEIATAIKSNNQALKLFLNKLNEIAIAKPLVSVNVNQDKVIDELRNNQEAVVKEIQISGNQEKVIGELRSSNEKVVDGLENLIAQVKQREWLFTVQRGSDRRIETITAKQTK